jgi:sulfite oxidase
MRRRDFLDAGVAALAAGLLPARAQAETNSLLQHTLQNLGTSTELFDRLIIPTNMFFVRSHFGPPMLDPARRLRISGMVDRPRDFAPNDLRKFKETTITTVLQCAGNGRALHRPRVPGIQWIHGAMGQATFTGVRLADVLREAGVSKDTAHVQLAGADLAPKPTVPAFIRSIPIARALDPSTLIAYRMNGEPLTLEHGAPLRLVVPGWAGDHWIKWLTDIKLQREEADGFYMKTGYRMPKQPVEPGAAVPPENMAPLTTFPVKSVIGRPTNGARAKVGPQEVVGVAFSGEAALTRVEVSIDGGTNFTEAKLEGEPGVGRWQVFRYSFTASKPGSYQAKARATDAKGNTQPETPAWNPSGYFWNGLHDVRWEVEP